MRLFKLKIIQVFASVLIFGVCSAYAQEEQAPLDSSDEAYRKAIQAMVADPSDPEKSFRVAEIASARGDFNSAISALERIRLTKGDLPNIDLELGVLYRRVGANELADMYMSKALADQSMPAEVRVRAEKLSKENRKEGARHQWDGSIYFALRKDSNANASPSEVLINDVPLRLSEESGAKSDLSSIAALNVKHRYDLNYQDGRELETNFKMFASRYNELDTVNMSLLGIDTGPRFYRESLSFRPYITANMTRLAGDKYSTENGAGLAIRNYFTSQWILDGTLEVLNDRYAISTERPYADERDGRLINVDAALTYRLTPVNMLSAQLFNHDDRADKDYESFKEYGLGLKWGSQFNFFPNLLSYPLQTQLKTTFASRDYKAPNYFYSIDTRKDKRNEIGVSVWLPFSRYWGMELTGSRVNNASTLPNFKYNNNSVTLGVSAQF